MSKELPELTEAQQAKLSEIRTIEQEITRFDHPPVNLSHGGPYYHDRWIATRPYQTQQEAIEAFCSLTGIPVEEKEGLRSEIVAARNTKDFWDQERRWGSYVVRAQKDANYMEAYGHWSKLLRRNDEMMIEAAIRLAPESGQDIA